MYDQERDRLRDREYKGYGDFSKLLIVLCVAFITFLGPDEIRQSQGNLKAACLLQFVSLGFGLLFHIKIVITSFGKDFNSHTDTVSFLEFMLVNAQTSIFLISYCLLGAYLFT